MESEVFKPLGERVAVLETKQEEINGKLEAITEKLDALLELKAKGMGALGLISLLIGSGVIGIVFTVLQLFNGKPHL